MTDEKAQKAGFKTRIKAFSDGMFRNYQIMRKRWEISNAEKKRAAEISRLGMTAFRLYGKKELTMESLEPQIQKIEKIDQNIKKLEEKLRDIIMNADLPRQLPAGQVSKPDVKAEAPKKPEPEKKPEPIKTAEPEKKVAEKKPAPAKKTAPVKETPAKKATPVKKAAPAKKPAAAKKPEPAKKTEAPKSAKAATPKVSVKDAEKDATKVEKKPEANAPDKK